MLESELWQTLKRGLSRDPLIHAVRIESTTIAGNPDVDVCRNGVTRLIELKVAHGNWLHFRNSQRGWIVRRAAAGGTVLVVAWHLDCLFLWLAKDLMDPAIAVNVDEKSFKVSLNVALPLKLNSWPKPFPWQEIADAIFCTKQDL